MVLATEEVTAMDESVKRILDELIERYPRLIICRNDIQHAYELLKECYDNDGKLLIGGNGGSCADSAHIVGELMKGFVKPRRISEDMKRLLIDIDKEEGAILAETLQGALPAINITEHNALNTAYGNDIKGGSAMAQQVFGYGRRGDVFLGITTSGNSKNIISAAVAARAKGLKVIGLTGRDGGRLKRLSDCTIIVPEQETFRIQELHLPVYHALCLMLEETYFS